MTHAVITGSIPHNRAFSTGGAADGGQMTNALAFVQTSLALTSPFQPLGEALCVGKMVSWLDVNSILELDGATLRRLKLRPFYNILC